MVRTIATTSLAFIVLAANAILVGARADYPYPQRTSNYCEETSLAPLRSEGPDRTRSRDRIVGGEGTTGPTVPFLCKQETTMHAIGDEVRRSSKLHSIPRVLRLLDEIIV
jgi:hypothetical protein